MKKTVTIESLIKDSLSYEVMNEDSWRDKPNPEYDLKWYSNFIPKCSVDEEDMQTGLEILIQAKKHQILDLLDTEKLVSLMLSICNQAMEVGSNNIYMSVKQRLRTEIKEVLERLKVLKPWIKTNEYTDSILADCRNIKLYRKADMLIDMLGTIYEVKEEEISSYNENVMAKKAI